MYFTIENNLLFEISIKAQLTINDTPIPKLAPISMHIKCIKKLKPEIAIMNFNEVNFFTLFYFLLNKHD